MKKTLTFCLLAVIIGISTNIKAQESMTQEEKISYALGASNGEYFKQQGIEVNTDTFMKGFKDGLAGTNQLPKPKWNRFSMNFNK